jgi:hypothetical protein
MKKVILSVVAITGLMAMSFTTVNSNKVSIVKTTTGFQLTNADKLSLEDLKSLKEMTIVGMKSTTIANTKVFKSVVDQTLYKTTDYAPNQEQEAKLNSILAKY